MFSGAQQPFSPMYLQVKSCVMNYAVPEMGEVRCAAQFLLLLIVSKQ